MYIINFFINEKQGYPLERTTKAMSKSVNKIDLTSLEGFSLGPKWEDQPEQEAKKKSLEFEHKQKQGTKKSRFKKDRFQKRDHKYTENQQITISIKPRIEIINIIKEKIRTSGISYSIREICNTLCEKKDRLCIQVELKAETDLLIINKSTGKCFISQKEAVDDIIYNHGKEYISSKVVSECEFKKGLNYALQCKTTKKLFPPPSFHCFEDIVRNHLFEHAINKEYNSYVNSLLRVDDQQVIDDLLKMKIQTFEYQIIANKGKKYASFDSLKSDMIKDFNKDLFTTRKKASVNYSNLNTLPARFQKDIERYLFDKKLWTKELYINCLVLFKKSKYIIYKKDNTTFVCNSVARNCDSTILNKKSEQIIKTILSIDNSPVSIKKLISKNELSSFSTTMILKELKWLVKEGYIREFSNSTICLA